MSTILKALRRLEQERTTSGRPLREQVTGGGGASDGGSGPPRRRWPILAGGVAAGVVAGLGVLFLTMRRDAGEVAAPAAPAPAAAQAGAAPPAAARRKIAPLAPKGARRPP